MNSQAAAKLSAGRNAATPAPASDRGLGWRSLAGIAALALLVRVLNVLSLAGDPSLFMVEDSIIYTDGAANLLRHGAFVVDVGGELAPLTERVPIYFLLVALPLWLGFDSWTPLMLIQAVLDSGTCALIASLGALLSRRVGQTAGVLAALWPNLIIHSAQVLTDSLFVLLLCAAMLMFARVIREPRASNTFVLGVTIGAALMTRTAAQFAPPVIALVILIHALRRRMGLRKAIGLTLAFSAAVALVASPVLVRNWTQYRTLQLTSQAGTHLLFWVTPPVLHAAEGISFDDASARLRAAVQVREAQEPTASRAGPFRHSRLLVSVALSELRQQPAHALIHAWTVGAIRTLGTPALLQDKRVRALTNASFAGTSGSLFERASTYLANNTPEYRWWAGTALLAALLASILQLAGACVCVLRWPVHTAFGAAVIAYFLVLNGPVGDAKYRLPIEPVLIVFTAVGWLRVTRRHTGRPIE